MKNFLLWIFCRLAIVAFVECGYIYNDLANFCSQNGFVYLSISTTDESVLLYKKAVEAYLKFENHNKRVRKVNSFQELQFNLDTWVILTQTKILSETNKFQIYLEQIGEHRIKKSVLVFTDLLDASQENELQDTLKSLVNDNAWFYLLYQRLDNITEYKNILSLSNSTKTLVQDLKLNKNNQIIQNYNLEGIKLYSKTLTWAPYFVINDCDEKGKNCEFEGLLKDYMDAMGRILNFTWTSHAPPDGNWGVRPISGPYNRSGLWGGAMGSVINGEYHISLSNWVWNLERYGLVDFVSTTTGTLILALTPKPADVDLGLFVRPFQYEAWQGVFVVFIVIVAIILLPYGFISYYEQTNSFKITIFWSWLFFVVINAYYSGALTMFFSSKPTLPFNSIEDVMRAYPDWELKMMHGNDVHFQYKALAGDPLYSAFWDRVVNKREETVFENVKEGLDKIQKERAVIQVWSGMLKGYFRSNPFHQQKLKVFARGKVSREQLIVPINSPLKPILQAASNSLTEAGVQDALLNEWEGKDIAQASGYETMILTPGQVISIFLLIITIFGFSIFILGCEIGIKMILDSKKSKPMKKLSA